MKVSLATKRKIQTKLIHEIKDGEYFKSDEHNLYLCVNSDHYIKLTHNQLQLSRSNFTQDYPFKMVCVEEIIISETLI